MNTANAIGLGAFCQRKFNLPDTFQIHFLPSDSPTSIRLPKPHDSSYPFCYGYPTIETEDVTLEQMAVRQGNGKIDYSWVGYSTYHNILFVIKELE